MPTDEDQPMAAGNVDVSVPVAETARQEMPAAAPVRLSVFEWAQRKSVPFAQLHAMAMGNRWEISKQVSPSEVTESEFDRAFARLYERL